MSKREALVEAAKVLLWERGFAAMSPRDVLRKSRAGQGSLYHFFDGKEALAAEALAAVADEVSQRVEATCGAGSGSGLSRIERFLRSDRDALRGCRLGRLAQDPELPESLRKSIAGGLKRLSAVLESAAKDAQREGDLPSDLDARAFAECLIAVVQGGYVLSRAHASAAHMPRVTGAMLNVLTHLKPVPGGSKPPRRKKQLHPKEPDALPKPRVRKTT